MHSMEDYFGQILVPTEEVVEMRAGQKRKSERKFYPGYVLVEMDMNEEFMALGEECTTRVLGFIGGTSDRPMPITQREADNILNRLEESVDKPKPKTLVRAGRSGTCYRRSFCRLQRCGRRSGLRKEPRQSIGAYFRSLYSSRFGVQPSRKRLSQKKLLKNPTHAVGFFYV